MYHKLNIIAWEKLLEPELQKEQQYPLLFQINLLTVQALITEGNISLAINQANQMYQKAREMDDCIQVKVVIKKDDLNLYVQHIR